MRVMKLAVVVLLSGCRKSEPPAEPPSPEIVLELPAAQKKAPSPEPTRPEPTASPEQAPGTAPSAPLPPELDHQTWTARSGDGSVEVRQLAIRDGKGVRCESSSTATPPSGERSVMWQWNTCIATREQLKFISPDGKRVLVIEPHPTAIQSRWRDVEVATLYEHGLRVTGTTAGALVETLEPAPEPSKPFAWMKGQDGVPGLSPRYSSDGKQVVLETVEGKSVQLGFDAVPSSRMFQYADGQGTKHFVASLGEVPERYRARARPVNAELSHLSVSLTPTKDEVPPTAPKQQAKALLQGQGEDAQLQSPAELLEKARKTAAKVEEVQRGREQFLKDPDTR